MNIPEIATAANYAPPLPRIFYDFNEGSGHVVFYLPEDHRARETALAVIGHFPLKGERVLLEDGEGNSCEAVVLGAARRNWDDTCWLMKTEIDWTTWHDESKNTADTQSDNSQDS